MRIIINPTDLPCAILSIQPALSKYNDSKKPLVGSIEAVLYSSLLWCLFKFLNMLFSGCL